MPVVNFDYALYDGNDSVSRLEEISGQTGIEIDPDGELAQLIGRPFYQVTLHCTLDTVTGAVQILGAEK